MCEPTTILMVASLATTVVGGAVAYDASRKAESYNNQVAKQNKAVAEAQAVDAERLGQLEGNERRLQMRMQIANQTVGFAAQNVEQTGTALDILGDTAMFGEVDIQRIQAGAARKAWGYRMQGYDIEANNRLQKFQGKADRMGIILSTASKAFSAGAGMMGGGAGYTGAQASAGASRFIGSSGYTGLGSVGW